MKRAHFLVIAVLLLAGCSRGLDHRVDGSSEAGYRASLAKIRKASSDSDMKRLEDAIRVLAVTDVSIGFEGGILGALRKLEGKPVESLAEFVMTQVDGRTGREILAEADKRKRDQAEKQLAAVEAEMARLKKAKAEKEAAKDFLAKIQIAEPRIAVTGTGAGRTGILDFKVVNGSEEALASLFLRAAVTGSEGRVLLADEFNYRASPPIGVGQTREVRLPSSAPNKWNSPELAQHVELGLQLQVENAVTTGGSRLAASFTAKDADRLALLERDHPVLQALVGTK